MKKSFVDLAREMNTVANKINIIKQLLDGCHVHHITVGGSFSLFLRYPEFRDNYHDYDIIVHVGREHAAEVQKRLEAAQDLAGTGGNYHSYTSYYFKGFDGKPINVLVSAETALAGCMIVRGFNILLEPVHTILDIKKKWDRKKDREDIEFLEKKMAEEEELPF
jgi:hypothetical protein